MQDTESEEWRELAARFPDLAKRKGVALYVLPDRLISAIEKSVPDFFAASDLELERFLSALGVSGFFLKHPFCYWPLTSLMSAPDVKNENVSEVDAQIGELLIETGIPPEAVENQFTAVKEREQKLRTREAGYAGWLISNPDFRYEVELLKRKWDQTVHRRGRFTSVRKSLLGERTHIDKRLQNFHVDNLRLFNRWSLETFVTWELPVPIRAGLETRDFYVRAEIEEAGSHFFVPRYLLRDRDLSLYDISSTRDAFADNRHLDPWFHRKSPNWSYERYSQMLKLYVYLELTLKKRYPDRLHGNTGRIDEAFARFWLNSNDSLKIHTRIESTKRTRLELTRRLRTVRGSTVLE